MYVVDGRPRSRCFYSFIFCRRSVGIFGQNVIKSRVSYNTPPLTMELFICAAYNLIPASVMHLGSFNSFIILKRRIRRPCDIS